MELKSANYQGVDGSIDGFNRTFMELKFVERLEQGGGAKVLIVPLWN